MSAGKISLSLGASRKPPPPSNGVKRSHAALRDHEEDEHLSHGKAQTVSHFDREAGGAIDEKNVVPAKGPLVIESLKNRDWKEASQRNKRMRYAMAAEAGKGDNGEREREVVEAMEREREKTTYGLNIAKKVENEEAVEVDVERNGDVETVVQDGDQIVEQELPRTADDEAMDALLGNAKKSTLVLPAMSEEQAFERDYKDAPDMASLADYDRVPVEEFGAAMLRGMGWKDGEGIGANRGKKMEQTKMPTRRPALLGIGAKEEAAVAQEMGAWGKAARGGKAGEIKVYNPVLLKDKKTGELFTEEELEKKKARDEREKYEIEFEEKERRRKDKDGHRKERDRETSRERRDRKEKERRRRDDSDEEYYRRKKEKERRRRERDDSGHDRDRERSRRHDSDRERRHDGGRERHRDRDRRH